VEWPVLLAQEALFGNDLLVWLVLALGGAMVAGNVAAIMRPPPPRDGRDLPAAPRGRSIAFIVLGSVVGLWALATLVTR
jgi:hypothetical protein